MTDPRSKTAVTIARGDRLRIAFPENWLAQHPLTGAEIERESEYLSAAGFTLQYA